MVPASSRAGANRVFCLIFSPNQNSTTIEKLKEIDASHNGKLQWFSQEMGAATSLIINPCKIAESKLLD